ncbi:MAG: glycoside hydrolase family 3 C-terminal domain-containing protein [Spirochaetales bacterium]|nr:glycoside hydrolase family 3 C-terminal domain-containing protein [Spirochaetales bacterium]
MKKKIIIMLLMLLSITIVWSQTYLDPNASIEARVSDLLSRMTLDEKCGQMLQAEKNALNQGDLANYCIGSILSGASSTAEPNNTASDWADMYDNFQQDALNGRLGIPVIYGVDAVHGFGNVYGSTVFPHNIGLGAARDPDLMEQIGTVTAREVAATGVDWTFGPCLTVPRDERWGRTYEGFGEDPEIGEMLAQKYILGFQGTTLQGGEKITATAKHWIADGGTTNGIDQGNTVCTEAVLRQIHLPPYIPALNAGVGTAMISFSSWNGTKCHEYSYLINEMLKNEFGFKGFVISDYNGIQQLSGTYSDQIRKSINAGIDMLMEPNSWQSCISNLRTLVNNGQIPQSRIDDAVSRILRVKFKLGLFENPYANRNLLNTVGSAAHRAVAREAVRKSLVLLKNENVLPLSGNSGSIFVAGKNADNMGNQCGAWTISWQGESGDITPGTTILEGIRETVTGARVTYNQSGSGAAGHDVAIVVIGETPYAEGRGYDTDLSLTQDDISVLNNVYSAHIPVIVVLVSGRPMIVTNQIDNWDGFVAAWLPGTEGRGVADVLFGDYDFTGKLPCTWPRTMSQIPINVGDSSYDPLFAYNYGLSCSASTPAPTGTTGPGDVNNDGSIDIVDALLIAQYYVDLNPPNFDISRADTNCNGNIDIVDALLIAQYYVGLIEKFC